MNNDWCQEMLMIASHKAFIQDIKQYLNRQPQAKSKPIKRRLRKIERAETGHHYVATYYVEYEDGSMKRGHTQLIDRNDTTVRMREANGHQWEVSLGMNTWVRM